MEDTESGFVEVAEVASPMVNHFTDVEVLRVSQVNVVARGKRYGRMWLIKGLSPELRGSTTGLRLLMKEFDVQSRLCHSSVAQAVSMEEVDGLGLCIVMEWVEGCMLADRLRTGELSGRERKRIMREIIVAADYLHQNGVVHRDLKPSNIMVRKGGRGIAIIDFGLADTDTHIELKQAAGTRGFISPEQLEHGGADPADDVYTLGVIMNELCPTYRRLSRLCTSKLNRRPANAGALLKIIDRRKRLRRIILTAGSMAAVVALVIGGVRHISMLEDASRNLETASHRSDKRMNELMLENKRNADYAAQLSDSLAKVHSRMIEAQDELNRTTAYTQLYNKMYKRGCEALTAEFDRFEKKVLPNVAPAMRSMRIFEFDKRLPDVIKKEAMKGSAAGLNEVDVKRLEGDIQNFYISEGQKRYQKWNEPLL